MNKKFLSLVLALVMVLGTFGSVFAETKAPEAKDAKKSEVKVPEKKDTNEKVQWLKDNEIVVGRTVNKDDKNADLALDKNIQRAEVTKLLIYAIGQQDLAKRLDGVYAPYKDVPSNHWANGLIAAGSTVASPANALPFLHGVGHNMFEPERQVRYDELAKMLVVLVKEDLTKAGLEAAKWPTDWMNWAAKLGIFDGIKTPIDGSKYAVREDAFVMLYNALYKIGELRNLPAGETMGIISDATANKIVLNQGDKEKKFTVSYNTNFVPGEYKGREAKAPIVWNELAKDKEYFIGSLVRVIADDKGNVSHIIQLGNPEDLALKSRGWVDVAKEQVETTTANPTVDLKKFADDKELVINKQTLKVNDSTRYFVADYKDNQLTEVKDRDAVMALFDKGTTTATRVYAGYDALKNSGVKEAKVVVFNDVDKDNLRSDLVRVYTPIDNNYKLTAQKPGKTENKVTYDLSNYKAGFPLSLNLEKRDVIELYDKDAKILIDHSEAPIYKIVKMEGEENTDGVKKVNGRIVEIKLEDKNGDTAKLDILKDADLFFEDEIKVGAYVQVRFNGETQVKDKNVANGSKALDIVSVVEKVEKDDLGILPNDIKKDYRQETGILKGVSTKDGIKIAEIEVDGHVNNYVISDETAKKLETEDNNGKEITFLVDESKYQSHAHGYAFNIVLSADQKDLDGIKLNVEVKVKEQLLKDAKTNTENAKKNKELVEKAVKEAVEKANPGVTVTKVEFPRITGNVVIEDTDTAVTANVTLQKGDATRVVENITVNYK